MPPDIFGVPLERAAAIGALAVIAWNILAWITARLWKRFRSPVIVQALHAGPIYSGTELQYELAQLWLVNRSHDRFPAVSAQVNVDPAGASGSCLWAIGTPPGQMAQWQQIATTVDIDANDLPHKLNIALRYPSEMDGHLASLDNRQAHPDYRDPAHRIPPGRHAVHIRLRGGGIDRTLHVRVRNEATLALEP